MSAATTSGHGRPTAHPGAAASPANASAAHSDLAWRKPTPHDMPPAGNRDGYWPPQLMRRRFVSPALLRFLDRELSSFSSGCNVGDGRAPGDLTGCQGHPHTRMYFKYRTKHAHRYALFASLTLPSCRLIYHIFDASSIEPRQWRHGPIYASPAGVRRFYTSHTRACGHGVRVRSDIIPAAL